MAKSALKIKTKIKAEDLRRRLKLKNLEAQKKLFQKHPQARDYLAKKEFKLEDIRKHSAKILGAGALTGTLLLTPPASSTKALPAPSEIISKLTATGTSSKIPAPQKVLIDTLASVLPRRPRPLTRSEEKFLERIFENIVGIKAKATLEGEHLNTTYGVIGIEQHLRRYPGDTLLEHGQGDVLREGLAPGLGAWGYFAPSKKSLTPALEETERWYAVVQTLYLPDWNRRQPYLKNWYKYRKVLIVNAQNGNAVVAAIADSGPAAWTGKHFGGSPEVMRSLGGKKYKKGPVVIFFVDDPENNVPLGPVDYNQINLPEVALHKI